MKNKLMLRLCLMMTALLSLYSCIHDEVYLSSDPSSTEYTNKSLWKQDEKYITNVMKVYAENEADIKKVNGIPYWNFATTIDSFDESFVAIPIVNEGKVISVLKVPRHGKKIYFYYTHDESDLQFFQALVFAKYKKAGMADGSTAQTNGMACTRQWMSMWFPDSESNPDPDSGSGHWESVSIIKCKTIKDECVGVVNEFGICEGGTGDDGGYTYPGGGGAGTEQEEEEPCEKTKAIINKPQIQDSLNAMKSFSQTSLKKERGFQELKNRTLVNGTVTKNLQVKFGIGSNSLGNIHVHPLKGIAMFSAGDIVTFLHLLREQDATTIGSAYAGMVSASGTYFINFTGTSSDIPPAMTEIQEEVYIENLVENYITDKNNLLKLESKIPGQQLSNVGLEKLFFNLLSSMGLDGKISLIKEENGNTSTIQKDSNGNPIPNPC
jgi:hypothetical protein